MKMYSQCLLVNKASLQQVAWIEKEYAEVGLLVTLEKQGEEIWKVKEVYGNSSSEALSQGRKSQVIFGSKLK